MAKKEKNKTDKTVRQFRITWPGFARVVWGICVVLLILAMVLTAGTAVVSLFMPQQQSTQDIDPQILQQLYNSLTITPAPTDVVTVTP